MKDKNEIEAARIFYFLFFSSLKIEIFFSSSLGF